MFYLRFCILDGGLLGIVLVELSDSFESVVEVEVAGSFVLGPVGSFVWEPAMQVSSFRSRAHTKYIHDNIY